MTKETLEEKIRRVLKDEIALVPYDERWPAMFAEEKARLLERLPAGLVLRIEHFGSTAVPGMTAKPVVDMLVEVRSLDEAREVAVPLLEADGYDYFWRPTRGEDTSPFYCWFIKRDAAGNRTHHIHMVPGDYPQWDGLYFRDYLMEHPEEAQAYEYLKQRLATAHAADRVAYTDGKSAFIERVTRKAKKAYLGITGD